MFNNVLILTVVGLLAGTNPGFVSPTEPHRHFKHDDVMDEVSVVVREDKLLVFSAIADKWIEKELRIRETVSEYATGGRVVVVVTNHRVLGFSALVNKWNEKDLRLDELLKSLEAKGNVGTVVTNFRAMSFNARTGQWVETPFRID
jgi:hypothetical protein